jgi:Ca2+-transporting ATPase
MAAYYQLPKEEVMKQLNTSLQGLNSEAITPLQQRFGRNILQETKRQTRLSILASQFKDVMILILVIAAIISFVVGEHTDALVILAIVIANAWMGYSQEYDAEQSMRMLQKMSTQYAIAIRDNRDVKIESIELVPGDIIRLQAGDIVPADARLLAISALKTDEASLTGESNAIDKHISIISEDSLVPGDQHNMVFKGTIVTNGTAKAIVTTTGMNTELGKIAGMMEVGPQRTPLQKRLTVFGKQLAVLVLLICALVFGFGLWRGEPALEMFLTALSLAVAALPEALPAVITIALARGASRMVKQKALVRKLPAVETLGSVTYICTDKTGTLTQNQMTVERTDVVPGKENLFRHAMMLSNDVRFSNDDLMGDSTETALVHFATKSGIDFTEATQLFRLQQKLPFDSQRMRMSTLHKFGNKWILFTKGAPIKVTEVISTSEENQSQSRLDKNREWARNGLRVLFFAYKIFDEDPGLINEAAEHDLSFLGMAGMIDPPRHEVIDAINECKAAGIKPVMITGDQALTALAIAERLHIADKGGGVKTGIDLQKINSQDFEHEVKNISVYARVSPEQKLNIVKALQKNGEFVAMTGDGVNDAPSLKQADIGLAMGITGTDVSKEAADMVLLDDNFATIVKAVREGRRIYENIRKFILYVLSCNLGEILTVSVAPILGLPIPLLPIHILWINLVTDGLPGIALVAEPAEKNIMHRPPTPPKENLFAGGMIHRIISTATIMAAISIFVQWWTMKRGYDHSTQQTAVFSILCFMQLANALSLRFMYAPMFSRAIFQNKTMWGTIILTVALQLLLINVPLLEKIFKTSTLPLPVVLFSLALIVLFILCIEIGKWFAKKRWEVS